MDYKDYINTRALEAFKEFLAKYERGEALSFTIFIDDCQLTMKPLGLSSDVNENDEEYENHH